MNLAEKLLAIDKGKFDEIETKQLYSRQMSRLLGEENATVTIQAISGHHFTSLTSTGLNKKGNFQFEKSFDVNAKIAAAGVINPDLKDEALQKHLGVATPAEAAQKLFKGEVNYLSDEIAALSGFSDNSDEEIKN